MFFAAILIVKLLPRINKMIIIKRNLETIILSPFGYMTGFFVDDLNLDEILGMVEMVL